MIEGLSHITLITCDLDRMSAIVTQVLDGREVYSSGDDTFSVAREKFFLVGGHWVAVMEGESLTTRTYNHIAFKIPPGTVEEYRRRAEALGLDIRESRPRVEGEGESLYFYDHDNHLFELHTGTLEERLERYRRGRLPERPMTTREQALRDLRRTLTEAGFETAGLDARLLLIAALGISPTDLITRPDAALSPAEAGRLAEFARRRLAHEPVARIVGEREFWGLPFRLSPETLVPRPDTETVIETALALIPDRQAPLTMADFGTGSGCILTALLHELPSARGLGIDRSLDALWTARLNAYMNGVGDRSLFVASDWASAVRGPFDLVASNPPYIASPEIPGLDREVREHDPLLALDGGPDGLDAYRILLSEAGRLLKPGGLMVLEIGYDQAEALRHLARDRGLEVLRVAHDLSGNPRCVALARP